MLLNKQQQYIFLKTNQTALLKFLRSIALLSIGIFILIKIANYLNLFVEVIVFDLEKTSITPMSEYFMANNGRLSDNALHRTKERSYTGLYSLKLDSINKFGLMTKFEIPQTSDSIEATVWIYSDKIKLNTVHEAKIAASIGNDFWVGSDKIVSQKNGWFQLKLKFSVPDAAYKEPLYIFCLNNNNYEVYYDDFTITIPNEMSFLN